MTTGAKRKRPRLRPGFTRTSNVCIIGPLRKKLSQPTGGIPAGKGNTQMSRREPIDLTELLEGLFKQNGRRPKMPDMDWHRATISSLELEGVGKLFRDDVKVGDEMFVSMACLHKKLAPGADGGPKFFDTRHTWTGKSFEDMPVDVLTIHGKVAGFECAVCDQPAFVSPEAREEMKKRPELPGPRKSSEICSACWEAVAPLAGNETMIILSKRFSEHHNKCRPCRLLPVPCPEALQLLELIDTIKFDGKTFSDVMSDLRDKSPAFKEKARQEMEMAGFELLLMTLAGSQL
jgi:hypothetical protein